MKDYKLDYESTWKEIVENSDGTLNKEQLMKELSDFSLLIDHIAHLYDYISQCRVSYPTTKPEEVIALYEQQLQKMYDEGFTDGYDHAQYEYQISQRGGC